MEGIIINLEEERKRLLQRTLDAEDKAKRAMEIAMCKIYYANPRDKIDVVLGEYLNNFPEREQLKIMFLRESEGVYRFGSKKVYIKVEKGNSILVRVGGGFLQIEEFLAKYTGAEIEKVKGNDVLQKFWKKIQV